MAGHLACHLHRCRHGAAAGAGALAVRLLLSLALQHRGGAARAGGRGGSGPFRTLAPDHALCPGQSAPAGAAARFRGGGTAGAVGWPHCRLRRAPARSQARRAAWPAGGGARRRQRQLSAAEQDRAVRLCRGGGNGVCRHRAAPAGRPWRASRDRQRPARSGAATGRGTVQPDRGLWQQPGAGGSHADPAADPADGCRHADWHLGRGGNGGQQRGRACIRVAEAICAR